LRAEYDALKAKFMEENKDKMIAIQQKVMTIKKKVEADRKKKEEEFKAKSTW
jgi:hypothetical protein